MTSTFADDDARLVRAAQQGDGVAFGVLCDRYRSAVYRLAYRFCHHAEDALDLASDVFMRVYRNLASFRGDATFSTWLYRIATNTCVSHERRPMPEPVDPNALPDAAVTGTPLCERRELQAQIRDAITELPEALRIVFILVAQEDFTYIKAAETLGISVEAVRMRMSRARQALREHLTPYLQEG